MPIPGTKKQKYLEENIAAVEITLTPSEWERLDRIAPKGVAAGDRYPESSMQAVNL